MYDSNKRNIFVQLLVFFFSSCFENFSLWLLLLHSYNLHLMHREKERETETKNICTWLSLCNSLLYPLFLFLKKNSSESCVWNQLLFVIFGEKTLTVNKMQLKNENMETTDTQNENYTIAYKQLCAIGKKCLYYVCILVMCVY